MPTNELEIYLGSSENEKLYPETNNLLINVSSGKQYSFIYLNKSTGSSPIY